MVAAVAAFSIVSCKKDQTEDPIIVAPDCKVTKIEYYDDNKLEETDNITYDANGKISKIVEDKYALNFTYSADKISSVNSDNEKVEVTLLNGRAIKSTQVGGSAYDEYTYNADGYLSGVKYYNGGLKDTYVLSYTNNNLTNITMTNGSYTDTYIFEYNSDLSSTNLFRINLIINQVINDFIPVEFLGKSSKNNISKVTSTTNYTSGGASYKTEGIITYTYVKDVDSKVTSATLVEAYKDFKNSSLVGNYTYNSKYNFTYSCK
ncbi:hypothetical protein EZ449_00405 [Pedobacter frigidisoli]|uniref:YD repeat-containing protein n=1 Tax=Pedobacter frigidisoli TaxID=2530455 RepID=A0A4V2MNF2_9SPHI|nr:DUF4595 domain-containing protein [Pedobacter frigidisoli]TCD12546.1 hypothetical protein EZ449_00405 [Pedobacter frigidisoli]